MTSTEALRWTERLFELQERTIEEETTREEIDAWDSLGVLTLMAGLNEDFGIEMTDLELQSLKTVKDILALIQNKGLLT